MDDILAEARQLVLETRQEAYDHPARNFARIAQIWSAILGVPVTPMQVSLCMIGVKLARQAHRHSRDNLVDLAGYAQTAAMVAENKEPKP